MQHFFKDLLIQVLCIGIKRKSLVQCTLLTKEIFLTKLQDATDDDDDDDNFN